LGKLYSEYFYLDVKAYIITKNFNPIKKEIQIFQWLNRFALKKKSFSLALLTFEKLVKLKEKKMKNYFSVTINLIILRHYFKNNCFFQKININ